MLQPLATPASPVGLLIASLAGDLERVAQGRHHDPHALLGAHERDGSLLVLAYLPAVMQARIDHRHELTRLPDSDFFYWIGRPGALPQHYRISWVDAQGRAGEHFDPYCFAPSVAAADIGRFSAGKHVEAWRLMGAHPAVIDDVEGVRFALWAPNAERVSVVGPFCDWDGRRYPMRSLGGSGVWELFMPGLAVGELYKFELRGRAHGNVFLKSDPYARALEMRPATASIVKAHDSYTWQDMRWMRQRVAHDWLHAPMSIYEVHLGSWKRHGDGRFFSYRELAADLIPYVERLGFTHIELLPVTEHPLDDSWGYQTSGYFAPTSRFGTPDELRFFIDQCHQRNIGVLLDWVPGHFPRDSAGLARFDGSALYEYEDPRKGEHADWGTLIFNYERYEVRSFLLASACYWLEEFHFDGLRVDAVASMLYLDFGRKDNFIPNRYGGNQNIEAIDFLRELNATTHARSPGTVVMAEESTDWSMVSRPTDVGGLGFSMKWNMGWMHDTLGYFTQDALFRQFHHDKLTFVMMYAYSENFILPLSHDEVVHLKRSLLGRMPGDRWQQLANLRLLYTYMWTLPGKKLLFMGQEMAQSWEWDFRNSLPWHLLDYPEHEGVQRLICDLNRLYTRESPLHRFEFESQGFDWIDCNDRGASTLSYVRRDGDRVAVVVLNFTPVPRRNYRVGVPHGGTFREALNSDSKFYGGSNLGNSSVEARREPWNGQPWHVELTLPPLAGLVLLPG